MSCLLLAIVSFKCLNIAAAENGEKVRVYGTAVSPYVRKVVTVLEEKKIPYDIHPILPANLLKATGQEVPEDFQKISPLGKIPAITHGQFSISDSSVISMYLDKLTEKNSVYPTEPKKFAQALWIEKYADTVMSEVLHALFVESFVKPHVLGLERELVKIEELKKKIPDVLHYLNETVERNKGHFIVGETLTIGDIAIAQHFISLKIANISLDMKPYPSLEKYLSYLFNHSSIQASLSSL